MSEDLQHAFWRSLKEDSTMLVGVTGGVANSRDITLRPMASHIDEDGTKGVYFFASRNEGVGKDLGGSELGVASGTVILGFISKDHELFATGTGSVLEVGDKATIDRLWSPIVSIFYEGGRDDPNLMLLRLAQADLELWRKTNTGFLKAIAYKLMGKDADEANPKDRGEITI